MSGISKRLFELLREDRRYRPDAYAFVSESLDYAQNVLQLGNARPSEPLPEEIVAERGDPAVDTGENHISGGDLCEAARLHAMNLYGRMAKVVLENMGIRRTRDIGNIVFNLINIGEMRKTAEDKIDDFDEVFEFETAFDQGYEIRP